MTEAIRQRPIIFHKWEPMRRKRALFESVLAMAAILLMFSFYLMITGYAFTTTETRATVKWDSAGNGTIYYLTACDDGTLRALTDGHVSAIGSDGSPLWSVDIPDNGGSEAGTTSRPWTSRPTARCTSMSRRLGQRGSRGSVWRANTRRAR